MTSSFPALPALPERLRLMREASRLRSALLRDRDLFRGCAQSCSHRNPGQASLMAARVKELDAILNPAASAARPDRPAGAGAADDSISVKGSAPSARGSR